MRCRDALLAACVSAVLHAAGCARLIGVDDWHAAGSGGSDRGGAGVGGGVAGTGADSGGGGAGGGVPGRCGGTSLFADSFDLGMFDARWVVTTETGSAYVEETAGDAVFTLDGLAPCSAVISSARYFDLVGDAVTVDVREAPTSFSNTYAELVVALDDSNLLRMRDDSSVLTFEAVHGGTSEMGTSVQFDPAQHAYWRIRETDGSIYWETSPDGMSFVVRDSRLTSNLFPVDVVKVALRGASAVSEGLNSTVRFAEVNGGLPRGALCKTRSLVDDFEDPMQSTAWALTPFTSPCTQVEENGELVMTPATNEPSACQYVSASDFDLTDSSLEVEVAQMLMPAMTSFEVLRARVDTTNDVAMYEQNGQLVASYAIEGKESYETIPFVHAAHRYWRIRESAGTMYWEASPDRSAWTAIRKAPTPLDVTRAQIVLAAGAGDVAAPGAVKFDNLNLDP